jgi:hypothetical protein
MNRQFLVSGILVSIAAIVIGGIIHAGLLNADYAQLPHLMRSAEEQMRYFHFNLIAHLFLGFGITWIYRHGRDPARPALGQGVRFGLAISCVSSIPFFLIYYAVQPFPGTLVAKQVLFETGGNVLLGILAAYLNRAPAPAAQPA